MSKTSFTAPLYTADVGRVENSRPIRVIVLEFSYGLESSDDPNRIVVPIGFCSDGNSVPPLFRLVITPWGRYAQAAMVHDLLYATNAVSRAAADRIFRDAIRVLARDTETDSVTMTGTIVSTLAYWAVRVFGGRPYKNGPSAYPQMATRAYERAFKKDKPLAPKIIRTIEGLTRENFMQGEAKREAEETVLKAQ